jgi:hypothetical protein
MDAEGLERPGQARASLGQLGEGPLAPPAVAGELDQPRLTRRALVEDIAREVHAGILLRAAAGRV